MCRWYNRGGLTNATFFERIEMIRAHRHRTDLSLLKDQLLHSFIGGQLLLVTSWDGGEIFRGGILGLGMIEKRMQVDNKILTKKVLGVTLKWYCKKGPASSMPLKPWLNAMPQGRVAIKLEIPISYFYFENYDGEFCIKIKSTLGNEVCRLFRANDRSNLRLNSYGEMVQPPNRY